MGPIHSIEFQCFAIRVHIQRNKKGWLSCSVLKSMLDIVSEIHDIQDYFVTDVKERQSNLIRNTNFFSLNSNFYDLIALQQLSGRNRPQTVSAVIDLL